VSTTEIGWAVRHLPCRLTHDELLERGDELARVQEEIMNAEARAAEIKQNLKSEMAALESRRGILAMAVRRREELRDVQCHVVLDYDRRTVAVVRSDTFEVVDSRPATTDELQQVLFPERDAGGDE